MKRCPPLLVLLRIFTSRSDPYARMNHLSTLSNTPSTHL